MQTASKPVLSSVKENKQLPVATFKNSLRDWRARWIAQRATRILVSGKEPKL
jgi:hypothetical protein